ncbi:hypothetical protein WPS_23020 [Vulcanimicrobium alpinum]|uniref:Uncharacterized protein n=1 Tax=Vulcanimicrobium alpinum TaxID=3016050 RepID=A0AAN1XYJ8_UNVUL|nr:hypothetical protein [Vulcanimicrobium alpinum]BDE07026.1 hypothetical protein WPS_23020 [Vulcanimicrobium alpinum]
MIAYERALAAAVRGERVASAIAPAALDAFVAQAVRKRLDALRALLPATLASLGRAEFEARYRAFSAGRAPAGAGEYRAEAVAFARSLRMRESRREAALLAMRGPRAGFALVRTGRGLTLLMRLRRTGRLHVVQFR